MADILFPPIPQPDKDGNVNAKDLAAYNKNMQDVIKRYIGSSASDGSLSNAIDNNYVKQIIQNHVVDAYNYTGGGTRASMRELTCLNTTIITSQVDSKIAIDMQIACETTHNTVYVLYRVIDDLEIEIGSPASAGSRIYGLTGQLYDTENSSTISIVRIQYIDSPTVVAETAITYKLKCYGDSGVGYFINRTLSDTDNTSYERTTSNVRLTEFGGTPVTTITSETAVATTAEAQAGTDDVKYLSPLKLRKGLNADGDAPVYACRAWVNFNGYGTLTKNGSGNVDSVTDNGTGLYTINFTTPMEDTNYSVNITTVSFATNNLSLHGNIYGSQSTGAVVKTANAVQIVTGSAGTSTKYDSADTSVVIFR